MSQLHRLQRIDARIRSGSYPKCRTIAEQFEISIRQASRDVEYLRYSMGAPVEYSAGHNGCCYSEPAFVLPAFLLSDTERNALAYLADRYRGMESETTRSLADVFKRISGGAGAAPRADLPVVPPIGEAATPRAAPRYAAIVRFDHTDDPGSFGFPAEKMAPRTFSVPFGASAELIRRLLALADTFVVEAPAWLRRRLAVHLETLAQKNPVSRAPGHHVAYLPWYPEGGQEVAMAHKTVANVRMGASWTSYVAAAHGALTASGWYDGDIHSLMGETGIGFHFIVHREACPSSVTVYDWTAEHVEAMDRIGVYTDAVYRPGDGGTNTAIAARRDAVERIKRSIDAGRPVLLWTPTQILEFGLVRGYDDADRVLFVVDCMNAEADPLPYDALGKSQVPCLFYQVLREKVAVDPERIRRDSLTFGLAQWSKESHVTPDYASGRKGYENLIGLLKKGSWNPFGLGYIFAVYACAKTSIATYLERVAAASPAWKGLESAAVSYRKAAEAFRSMSTIHPFRGPNSQGGNPVDKARVPDLIRLAEESREAEEKAFADIQKVLGAR